MQTIVKTKVYSRKKSLPKTQSIIRELIRLRSLMIGIAGMDEEGTYRQNSWSVRSLSLMNNRRIRLRTLRIFWNKSSRYDFDRVWKTFFEISKGSSFT